MTEKGPGRDVWYGAICSAAAYQPASSDTAGNVKLLPLEALTGSGLSVVALRHAARRGALTAKRQANGEWISSKKWVDEYSKSRWKGLRKTTRPT